MDRPKWPKLSQRKPVDIKEHAALIDDYFKAILQFLRVGVSDIAPSLPKGIESKIKRGIEKGLVEVESRDYCTTSISVEDRDLISNTILKEITAATAAAFHNRVPLYLFEILQDSYNELNLKLVAQQIAAPQQGVKMAGKATGNETLPHTPPDSPPEDTDSDLSVEFGSDTEGLVESDWCDSTRKLDTQASKLKAHLQEVNRERKAVSQRFGEKASQIKQEMQKVELEKQATDKRYAESLEAMERRRFEQDRTGDYGTEAVGYHTYESHDLFCAKRDGTGRRVFLNIAKQAVVNRLFNMPAGVLLRKVKEAVMRREEALPSLTCFLGAELSDDGNVALWADDDRQKCEGDAFNGLREMPLWDQDIIGSFASHAVEPYDTYTIEVKNITLEMVGLRDRKQKAAVITKLVKQNVTAIPSLHIDIVKDIRFSRRTTNDNSHALVLDFSNPATANDVISHGLQWQGELYSCEVFDRKFFDRCGRCQTYGHHADSCSGFLRCGNCTGPHRTRFCTSSLRRCALCDEPHRSNYPRCRARRIRVLDKINARFPRGEEDHPSLAGLSGESKASSQSLSSLKTSHPILSGDHVSTTKAQRSDPASPPLPTEPRDTPTPVAQQFQDILPAIEAALRFDFSNMRREIDFIPLESRAVTGPDEPAALVEEEEIL